MADRALIQIRIAGSDVAPGTVRSREIADIIAAVEDMIAALVSRDTEGVSKDEVMVGLIKISEGSLLLDFLPASPRRSLRAYSTIANSVVNEHYRDLPTSTLESLNRLASFARRRHCNVDLCTVDGEIKTLATITPETTIERIPLISGWTTIHGRVIRVGGKEPKVMIELPGGDSVSCETNDNLARQLGRRLYSWVGLRGFARWNSETFTLDEFRVDAITEYEDTPIPETFAKLRELVGSQFDAIGNVDDFVARVRGGQEDQK